MKTSARVSSCLFLAIAPALSQELSATLGKVSLVFEMRLDNPPGDAMAASSWGNSGVMVGKGSIHRYVAYGPSKRFLGYDASIREVSEGAYALDIRPLSLTAKQLDLPSPEAWTPWPPPRYNAPPAVRHGDKLEFPLLTGPGGQQLIEQITVKTDSSPPTHRGSNPAQDFRVEDAEFELSDPEIRINGTALNLGGKGGGIRGAPLVLYLEGRGRLILTLVPRLDLGFVRAGEVRGTQITFRSGPDQFEIRSGVKIAPGSGAFHLYLFHDPAYRPAGGPVPSFWGTGGALEYLTRRR